VDRFPKADLLFGKVCPSGKLTITFPRSVGQLPCYYNRQPSTKRSYLLADNTQLFPFGYGLSYSSFEYKNLKITPDKINIGETAKVSIEVKNSGKYDGIEIVQLYIHDKISSVCRPVKELKDFARIALKQGETKTVTFTVTSDKLEFFGREMKRVIEPGDFEIMVGKNSEEYLTGILVVR